MPALGTPLPKGGVPGCSLFAWPQGTLAIDQGSHLGEKGPGKPGPGLEGPQHVTFRGHRHWDGVGRGPWFCVDPGGPEAEQGVVGEGVSHLPCPPGLAAHPCPQLPGPVPMASPLPQPRAGAF